MSRIHSVFDNGPALIPYITAGDPDPSSTSDHVHALVQGGADIIELGLPFSEPIADGPTIQAAIERSLAGGMTPSRFFELVSILDVEIPLVVMTYYNVIHQYGDQPAHSFVADAARAGLDGIIVPDLPVEESTTLRDACTAHDIDLIFIVAPTTRGHRLDHILTQVSGFVYVQARLGTTGARRNVSEQTHTVLSRLSEYDIPKAVGFGVSQGEHAAEIIRAGADGVVAGSVFVDIIASGESVSARLEAKSKELKQAMITVIESAEPEHK